MKPILMTALAMMLSLGSFVRAGSADSSPLIGSWSVDIARLPMPPEARPNSVPITFDFAADGKWATRVEVIGRDGSKSEAEGIAPLDGKPAPVKGNFEADTAAVKMPTPNVLVMVLAKGGIPGSTRVYAVGADGKSMIETAAYYGQDGSPIMRTNYFRRIR